MSNLSPTGNYSSSVPQGNPMQEATPQSDPVHGLHDSAPMQQTVPPAKPEAVTGPGGPSISVPTAGKNSA